MLVGHDLKFTGDHVKMLGVVHVRPADRPFMLCQIAQRFTEVSLQPLGHATGLLSSLSLLSITNNPPHLPVHRAHHYHG